MTDILRLESYSFGDVVILILIIIAAFNTIVKLLSELYRTLKKPFAWIKRNDNESELLTDLKTKQADIERQIISLTNLVIDDRICRMRHEILDTASTIAEGKRWISPEQLRYAMHVCDEYEQFLEEHHRSNGQVTSSIPIIRKEYQSSLECQHEE